MDFMRRWVFSPGCLEPLVVGGLWGWGVISWRVMLVIGLAHVLDAAWEEWERRPGPPPGPPVFR